MTGVIIRGGGAAAYSSAFLLRRAGVQVAVNLTDRARVPVLMLSDAAIAMMRDVFDQPDLFAGAHRIRQRIVAWGKQAEVHVLPHSAAVVSEETVVQSLQGLMDLDLPATDLPASDLPATDSPASKDTSSRGTKSRSSWNILSARPLPSPAAELRFGSRNATAMRVTLKTESDSSACWIESLEHGWLFLIPNAVGFGWLLAVGDTPAALLASSRLVRAQILGMGASLAEFPAFPRILSPLCAPGWLACGTAAMAFDPICGDGTAHAIREAILAAAVIQSAADGGDVPSLLHHYETRLTAGFERHLRLCVNFYRSGFGGSWWDTEAGFLEEGIRWCESKSASVASYRYRLNGFALQEAC